MSQLSSAILVPMAAREFDNDGLYAPHLLRREAEDTDEARREERQERRAHASATGLSRTTGEFSRRGGDDLNVREIMHRVRTEPPGPFTRTPLRR